MQISTQEVWGGARMRPFRQVVLVPAPKMALWAARLQTLNLRFPAESEAQLWLALEISSASFFISLNLSPLHSMRINSISFVGLSWGLDILIHERRPQHSDQPRARASRFGGYFYYASATKPGFIHLCEDTSWQELWGDSYPTGGKDGKSGIPRKRGMSDRTLVKRSEIWRPPGAFGDYLFWSSCSLG